MNDPPQVVKASALSMHADDTSRTIQSQDDDLNSLGLWMQGINLCVESSVDAYLHET